MKKFLLFAVALLSTTMMQAGLGLVVEGHAISRDTTITITQVTIDDFTEIPEMGWSGTMFYNGQMTVYIERTLASSDGYEDQLCAGACLTGTAGALKDTMNFDMHFYNPPLQVFGHYHPEVLDQVQTIRYRFVGDGDDFTLTVKYDPRPATPTSFPRKHLIEHFTGEACGYCPYGMESIEEFLASTTKDYIWVSHHYGYNTDEYTIAANSTIGRKLSVDGAPSVVFDRTKRRVNGTNAFAFHPGYLTEANAVPLTDADTALANVVIDRTYDANSRVLTLTVHGQVLMPDTMLMLSVLIKESGTVGQQADYYGSWEGWQQFRHIKTVRAMLSAALGDKVSVVDGEYTKTYSYTLPAAWKADSCTAVAYITKNAITVQPIINAEQIAVVEGTDGGESIKSGGITAVPVSATYPENGTPRTDVTFTTRNINSDNLAQYGYLQATLTAPTTTFSYTTPYGPYTCYPYMTLYIFSPTATLAAGTYPISETAAYGVVAAGYRDDDNFEIGGSMLRYVFSSGGSLYEGAQWLLTGGTLTVYGNGAWEINATTLNGSTFRGIYGDISPVEHVSEAVKAQKSLQEGKVVIRREGRTYDLLGTRLH